MLKLNKIFELTFLLLLWTTVYGLWTLTFAQEESVTITTYYPSPYGSYDELGTNKLAVDIGNVAVSTEYAAMNDGDAHIGRSLIVGARSGSGFAYDEGAVTADGTVLIKGNVGIGTNDPQGRLHLNGSLAVGAAGDQGISGQVLQSQGPGVAPLWTNDVSTGLFGYCQEWFSGIALSPASQDAGPPITCKCPTGYQKIILDQGGQLPVFPFTVYYRIFSCYKE